MFRRFGRRSSRAYLGGLASGLLVGVGMLVGALVAQQYGQSPTNGFPEPLRVNASATHGGETFAMCTGMISEGVEGVFMLDFLTGDLQVMSVNPRTRLLGGAYKHNVLADLLVDATSKKPAFLMVTGLAPVQTGGAAVRPADSVLYIADATSGNWVAYAIPWNRQIAIAGGAQGGSLVKVGTGNARNVAARQ